MTRATGVVSRRGFLGGVAALAGAGALQAGSEVEYACGQDCVEVWRGRALVQRVGSERAVFAAVHPGGRVLFVVNEVAEYRGLPCGSVESFAIEQGSGKLTSLGRQRLALSATLPRHLAIAPDGLHVVVAAYGGGSYNVLPVDGDGQLGRVEQCVKEIGRSARATPRSVVFHPSGRFVLGTDIGSDRVTVFAFQDGRLRRLQHMDAPFGSGPGAIQMNAAGTQVRVEYQLRPGYGNYRFDGEAGRIILHAEEGAGRVIAS